MPQCSWNQCLFLRDKYSRSVFTSSDIYLIKIRLSFELKRNTIKALPISCQPIGSAQSAVKIIKSKMLLKPPNFSCRNNSLVFLFIFSICRQKMELDDHGEFDRTLDEVHYLPELLKLI